MALGAPERTAGDGGRDDPRRNRDGSRRLRRAGDDLLFAPGDTTKTVDVTVHGDTAKEGNETFTLQLSGATNASVSDATGIATILDDDDVPSHESSSPIASIGDVSIEEGHAGEMATATFDVRLSHPAVGDVTLGYRSVAGTATDGHDYLGVAGIMTIPAGGVDSQVDVTCSETTSSRRMRPSSWRSHRHLGREWGLRDRDDRQRRQGTTWLTVRDHVFGSRVAVQGRLVRGSKGFPICEVLMRRKDGRADGRRDVAIARARAHLTQGGGQAFGYRTIFRHVDPGRYRIRTVFRGDATHAHSRAHIHFRF